TIEYSEKSKRSVAQISYFFIILGMLLWYALLCIPMGLMFYGFWRLTRLRIPSAIQRLIQAGLMGIAFAPYIYGHAGRVPAIFVFLGASGKEKVFPLTSILIVITIGFAVLSIRARKNAGQTSPA